MNIQDLLGEYTLNYSKKINKHQLDVLAGYTAQQTNSDILAVAARNYTNDLVPEITAGGSVAGDFNRLGSGKSIDPYHYVQIKSSTYSNGAVSSAHPLASMVGATIMKNGGNAFDAAVATQLALAVVYPAAGNIGGGGFLVARKNNGQLLGIDYREVAPAKASRDMYIDSNGNAQTSISQNGRLAAGVPGTVAGLFATLKNGKLPIKVLIQPAIDLAEFGFVLTEKEASSLNSNKANFIKYNAHQPAFVKNTAWKEGDTLIQKELANLLRAGAAQITLRSLIAHEISG